jgi:hypothetical protein
MEDTNSLLLHTDCIAEFNEKYFEKVLNVEHITSDGSVNFPKVKSTNGEDLEINFFGWIVTKNGVSWLVPNTDDNGTPVKIKDIFPLVPTKYEEVGYQSKGYRLVKSYQVVKYKSDNRLGMRALVDKLSDTPHSNPKHRKLLVMAILSQVFSRSYYRFSSPPGFGKDSIVDTLGLLIGGCATIENPSVPKLEREASIRTLCGLNEVVGLTRSQWVDMSKFMLAACAYKPSITKRTRAFGGVGETINLRKFSMSLFYNDITSYTDLKTIYFDDLAEEGIRDRLPAFRLWGNFTWDFNRVNNINIVSFVEEHWDDYLDIIYTITYYKDNLHNTNKYSFNLNNMSQRWKRSIGILLMVIQEYSESQKEFDEWLQLINDSLIDYKAMIVYPSLLESLKKKIGDKEFSKYSEKLISMNTFTERIRFIDKLLMGEPVNNDNKDLKVFW